MIFTNNCSFRPNQYLSNKVIKQPINSRRIVPIGYWRTAQNIMTWLQQQKNGCTSWTKTFRLQSQIGVAIFVSFRQEKPCRQKWIPSPFFVTVSWSIRHYGQADLLSLANFLIVVLESSSWQSLRKRCPYSKLFWSVFSRIRNEYEPE